MKKKTRRHWTHEERAPTSAWERALRPNGSSFWLFVLLLVAAGVFLALAVWTGLQDARESQQAGHAPQTSAVPGASAPDPDTNFMDSPRRMASASGAEAGNRSAECARLDAAVIAIDAAARQSRSVQEQERLKAERMGLRDRYFSIPCS